MAIYQHGRYAGRPMSIEDPDAPGQYLLTQKAVELTDEAAPPEPGARLVLLYARFGGGCGTMVEVCDWFPFRETGSGVCHIVETLAETLGRYDTGLAFNEIAARYGLTPEQLFQLVLEHTI